MTGGTVALAIGDPAGIGPEVVLKTVGGNADGSQGAVVVGDVETLTRHAAACGIDVQLTDKELHWPDGRRTRFIPCNAVCSEEWDFGRSTAGGGRACLAYAKRAVELAQAGQVSAVLAAP